MRDVLPTTATIFYAIYITSYTYLFLPGVLCYLPRLYRSECFRYIQRPVSLLARMNMDYPDNSAMTKVEMSYRQVSIDRFFPSLQQRRAASYDICIEETLRYNVATILHVRPDIPQGLRDMFVNGNSCWPVYNCCAGLIQV